MAIYEKNGTLTYKDKDGDLYKLYPSTKKECIDGMDAIDAHLANTSNPHSVTASQIKAVPTTRKINKKALSSDVTLTPADLGITLDAELETAGYYADAKATGDAIAAAKTAATTQYNDALDKATAAQTTADSKISMTKISITLAASKWSDKVLTVTSTDYPALSAVTANSVLIISSRPTNYISYTECGVYCYAQAAGSLTFKCSYPPTTANLVVDIILLK